MQPPSLIPPEGRAITPDEHALLLADMEVIIEQSQLFESLDDAGRARVLESGYVCAFSQGETIIQQGDHGDTMYLVLRGTLHVTTVAGDTLYELADLGRGVCVGEVSVLTGNPRTATVVAKTDAMLVAFKRHRIDRVLADYPKVRTMLEALVEGRAHDAVLKIVGP